MIAMNERTGAAPEYSGALLQVLAVMETNERNRISYRRSGESVTVTFAECLAEAKGLARSLLARGVKAGEIVAIHGDTSYEWLVADLACVLSGAISLALYPGAPTERVIAAAAEARVRLAFTDKLDAARAFARKGVDVVLLDGRVDPTASSVAKLVRAGGAGAVQVPLRRAKAITIVSTSGTLSEPKLFAASAEPLLFTMDRFAELYGLEEEKVFVALPLSHLPQRMMTYGCLRLGFDIVLSDPRSWVQDSHEFSPTVHVTVPRVLGHLWDRVMRPAPEKRGAYRAAFGSAARHIFVGSAATPPVLLENLLATGAPIHDVYGTTELGMVALSLPNAKRPGTVGRAAPWVEVRTEPDSGEVLVRTPQPFLYGRVVDGEVQPAPWVEGAFGETGDVGRIDADGYLTILGRTKDFVALASGEKVFVRPIEEAVVAATGAALCVVAGNGERQVSALLFFDEERAVASDGSLMTLCRERLREVNRTLHPWERIRAFGVVPKAPSVLDGTLTETLKVRRHKILDLYGGMRDSCSVGVA